MPPRAGSPPLGTVAATRPWSRFCSRTSHHRQDPALLRPGTGSPGPAPGQRKGLQPTERKARRNSLATAFLPREKTEIIKEKKKNQTRGFTSLGSTGCRFRPGGPGVTPRPEEAPAPGTATGVLAGTAGCPPGGAEGPGAPPGPQLPQRSRPAPRPQGPATPPGPLQTAQRRPQGPPAPPHLAGGSSAAAAARKRLPLVRPQHSNTRGARPRPTKPLSARRHRQPALLPLKGAARPPARASPAAAPPAGGSGGRGRERGDVPRRQGPGRGL